MSFFKKCAQDTLNTNTVNIVNPLMIKEKAAKVKITQDREKLNGKIGVFKTHLEDEERKIKVVENTANKTREAYEKDEKSMFSTIQAHQFTSQTLMKRIVEVRRAPLRLPTMAEIFDGCRKPGENPKPQLVKKSLEVLPDDAPLPEGANKKTISTRCCQENAPGKLGCTSTSDNGKCLPEMSDFEYSKNACQQLKKDGGGWDLCSSDQLLSKGVTGTSDGACCDTGCYFNERYVWTRNSPDQGLCCPRSTPKPL